MNPDDLSPAELTWVLSQLPPCHLLVTAARVGIELAIDRDEAALMENYLGGRWHRPTVLPSYTELERRRYPPHGDRELWIQHGPPGHVNYEGRRAQGGAAA